MEDSSRRRMWSRDIHHRVAETMIQQAIVCEKLKKCCWRTYKGTKPPKMETCTPVKGRYRAADVLIRRYDAQDCACDKMLCSRLHKIKTPISSTAV